MNRRNFFGLLAAAPLAPLIPPVAVKRRWISMPNPIPEWEGNSVHHFHSRVRLPPEKIAEIYRDMLATEFGPYDIPSIGRALDA